MSVELPQETKDTLLHVLSKAASQERTVIEFTLNDGELFGKEITKHVAALEEDND